MSRRGRIILPNDVISMEDYSVIRKDHRSALSDVKRQRRVEVGPFATFYFENYETMWYQVHEMMYIERGKADQIEGELAAYNPLIPRGDELVATLMFEIDNRERRNQVLEGLGGVERTITLTVDGEEIMGLPRGEDDRTNAYGKTSAVHFLYFPFKTEQISKFPIPEIRVTIEFKHKNYGHLAVLSGSVRSALAMDFN